MAWKQITEIAHCKECNAEFRSKMVFGQMTTRCNECRDKRGFKFVARPTYNYMNAPHWKAMDKPCPGTTDGIHQYNPGGYCNHCSAGGDFS